MRLAVPIGVDLKFPAGLARLVHREARRCGMGIRVVDERQRPPDPLSWGEAWPRGEALFSGVRSYQRDAVEAALRATRGLIKIPTGGGKSAVACALIARCALPTLFVTHKLDLVEQFRRNLRRHLGVVAGIVGGGKWDPDPRGVTVGTFQALASRMKSPAGNSGNKQNQHG